MSTKSSSSASSTNSLNGAGVEETSAAVASSGETPRARLCHLKKWPHFQGYGFNLHAERSKMGQHIGKVDANSPAESAGLREGDRIIEVNYVNISNENHQQVVKRIRTGLEYDGYFHEDEVILLVVDKEADDYYKKLNLVVKSSFEDIDRRITPSVAADQKNDINNNSSSSSETGTKTPNKQLTPAETSPSSSSSSSSTSSPTTLNKSNQKTPEQNNRNNNTNSSKLTSELENNNNNDIDIDIHSKNRTHSSSGSSSSPSSNRSSNGVRSKDPLSDQTQKQQLSPPTPNSSKQTTSSAAAASPVIAKIATTPSNVQKQLSSSSNSSINESQNKSNSTQSNCKTPQLNQTKTSSYSNGSSSASSTLSTSSSSHNRSDVNGNKNASNNGDDLYKMSAAEFKNYLKSKGRNDPRGVSIDMRRKYEIFQNM